MTPKLTAKQQAFVAEYLIDLNASAAYQRAYPGAKPASARVQSCRLLVDPNIQAAIAAGKAARAERVEITADRVLQELAKLVFFDVRTLFREDGTLKPPSELDDIAASAVSSVEVIEEFDGTGRDKVQIGFTKKVKLWDKRASLALMMQHLGMLVIKTEDVTDPIKKAMGNMKPEEAQRLLDALDQVASIQAKSKQKA